MVPFRHRQKLLFIGDSITDCGRCEDAAYLGDGYVWMLRNFPAARYRELQLTIVNRGVSGGTTRLHVRRRWQPNMGLVV